MDVKVVKDTVVINCLYSEKELVKAIGDFKFDKATSTWRFPLRKLVDIIDSLKVDYSEETKIIYDHLRDERQKYHEKVNLANKIKSDTCLVDTLNHVDLSMCYQHQKKAIALASMFGSYALFMEMGTGKSICAIKLIEYWKVPAMIIAPLSTLESVWVNEIKKWSKLSCTVLWHNLKDFNNGYDVFLINFEHFKKLSKTVDITQKIKCMVVDEVSKMKNHRSEITKEILKYKQSIPHRLVLSGLPSPNSLLEYFSPMEFINEELLG